MAVSMSVSVEKEKSDDVDNQSSDTNVQYGIDVVDLL